MMLRSPNSFIDPPPKKNYQQTDSPHDFDSGDRTLIEPEGFSVRIFCEQEETVENL